MKVNIGVDVGGTFTDCVAIVDGRMVTVKTPSIRADPAKACVNAVIELASALGIPMSELLQGTEMFNYSGTIATNALIQRAGTKLGLITTGGFEDTLICARGSSWADGLTTEEIRNVARAQKPLPLIPRQMTVGVRERVDSTGKVLIPLDEEDTLEKMRYLISSGARGLVVSLLYSYLNPAHEVRVRELIEEEFPSAYLGSSLMVMLSSEVCSKQGEFTRTQTTVINAFLQEITGKSVAGLADELSGHGYKHPMMLIHNSGGMSQMNFTTAIQTLGAGPVAGLVGSGQVGKLLGFDNLVLTDMGGTSFDLGLVVGGSTRFYRWQPIIDRWWVDMPMLEVSSIGAGGGSIAWLNPVLGNRLQVGPRSAGSQPGPASYAQGGTEPTVTDANVVLGYIDPDYFHGGRKKLSKEGARAAIREKIARPLGIEVEEAAALIRRVVDANMSDVIRRETVLRGYDPEDFVLFAYGGGGPTHCCAYGFEAQFEKIIVFPFSPVFCALGAATMDVLHTYEQSMRMELIAPLSGEYVREFEPFNAVVRGLEEKAIREIRSEGFSLDSLIFSLELDMKYGGQLNMHRTPSPRLMLQNIEDARAIYQQFEQGYTHVYGPVTVYPEGGVEISNFVLRAILLVSKISLPSYPPGGELPPKGALKRKRAVYWKEYGGFRQTPVYDQALLQCGNMLEGPCIVEAESTNTVLPPGTRLSVDQYLNQILEKV